MISVKEAAELASHYGHEVFHKTGTIEEVEVQGKYWIITLGFDELKRPTEEIKETITPTFSNLFGINKLEKAYKTFKINGETKELVSAKMYKL